ncbi:MAG: hypothetical protein ACOYEL_07490 [Saccharofermentanales bacterium]|jgi:hypothetical protein
MEKHLAHNLFLTEALKIADPDQPFWYTSGKLGPFFINTHYLFGSAAEAGVLLQKIEEFCQEPETMPIKITALCLEQYEQEPIYRSVIDAAIEVFKNLAADTDFISGGERRDFFFSLPLAAILNKPHLSCFKDGRTFYSEAGQPAVEIATKEDSVPPEQQDAPGTRSNSICGSSSWEKQQPAPATQSCNIRESAPLQGQQALHIADIITVASSFFRNWIPQIERTGASLKHAAAILDRGQGGRERLATAGTTLTVLGTTDAAFFARAVELGQISPRQAELCLAFLRDPDQYMADFLKEHPGFIAAEINKGGKNKERAQLALEMGYAQL